MERSGGMAVCPGPLQQGPAPAPHARANDLGQAPVHVCTCAALRCAACLRSRSLAPCVRVNHPWLALGSVCVCVCPKRGGDTGKKNNIWPSGPRAFRTHTSTTTR